MTFRILLRFSKRFYLKRPTEIKKLIFFTDSKIFLRGKIDKIVKTVLHSMRTEPPVGNAHCTRLYGIFADEAKCDVFWNCWNGEASRYQCSPGLAYDREARVCMWADQVPECRNEGLCRRTRALIDLFTQLYRLKLCRSCQWIRLSSCR